MADKKNDSGDKKPYVKPMLVVHGTLTFLATQSALALPMIP